ANSMTVDYLTNVNGTIFFQGGSLFGSSGGLELWKSDGTPSGTVIVKDIDSGSRSSLPIYLTNVAGTLYFVTNDGGEQIWQSDGTAAGTFAIAPAFSSIPSNLTAAGGNLFFVASDGVHGAELWAGIGGRSEE